MGGPGSGRRKGGRGGATIGTKIGVTTAKNPTILANRTGMSKSMAKAIFINDRKIAKRKANVLKMKKGG